MKRIFSLIGLLLAFAMLFAACDTATEAHDCEFATEWSNDDDYHWYACKVENCTEVKDKAAHDFEVKMGENDKPQNVCKTCGYTNDKVTTAPEHEHVFADKYMTNENFHWYACTVENCYEMKDKTEHSFGNPETEYADGSLTVTYTCVDCEYKKVETSKVDTEVKDALAWDNMFKGFKLTNFSMHVYLGGTEETSHKTNSCVVTDTGVYYCIPDSREFYVIKNPDGTYKGYLKNQAENKFYKMETDLEGFFKGASTEPVIQLSFEDNFDKFTYDAKTATYSADEVIEAITYSFNGEEGPSLYCHTSEVKIVDGKINYIACEYSYGSPDASRSSFVYYNIGISNVEIPQSVIDEAEANGAITVE